MQKTANLVLSRIHVNIEHTVECCRIWTLLIAILDAEYFLASDDVTVASWRVESRTWSFGTRPSIPLIAPYGNGPLLFAFIIFINKDLCVLCFTNCDIF